MWPMCGGLHLPCPGKAGNQNPGFSTALSWLWKLQSAMSVDAITEKPRPIGTLSFGTTQEGIQFSQGELTISEPMPTPVIRQLKAHLSNDQTLTISIPRLGLLLRGDNQSTMSISSSW